jgi:hypothetical protein
MTVELNDRLRRLESWESPQIPIISLYLNLRPEVEERKTISARLRNLLDPISHLEEGLDHEGRMALRAGIGRLLALEPDIAANTGRCVALFVGGRPPLDEFVTLPRKAWDIAFAGPRPYLRPYLATLDKFHRIATVVVDPRHSLISVSHMGKLLDRAEVESDPIRKADYAGWHGYDEHRVRQHAEEVHRRHYRELGEALQRLQQNGGFDAAFVGGRDEAVTAFLHQLPPQLSGLVAETFSIDTHSATPGQVARITSELEERYEARAERDLIEAVLEAARSGGPGTIGIEPSLNAANLGAVDLLLIAGTAMVPGFDCSNCGWLSMDGPHCPSCGQTSSAVPDIFETLAIRVRRAGAVVEHVTSPSELDGTRIAARLRFPVPALSA